MAQKKSNLLELTFKDNEKKFKIDLNKNIVFHGINGKGKTRILKTINTLYKIAKMRDLDKILELITEMNLKELRINTINYNRLLSQNTSITEAESRIINEFIDKYYHHFEKLYNVLNHREYNKFLSPYRYKSFFRYFENTVLQRRRGFASSPTPTGFNRWMNDLSFIGKRYGDIEEVISVGANEKEKGEDISNVLSLINFLNQEYQDILYKYLQPNKEDKIDLQKSVEEIMENLSLKSAHYISTESPDIEDIEKVIHSKKKYISEEVRKSYWTNSNIFEEIPILLDLKKELEDISVRFNKFMKEYSPITMEFQGIYETMIFKKAHHVLPYEKFSSGEKKIIYLFLSIIVNDVDIYLIDEPESSLSLNYQNRIIRDLHDLTENKVLMIATHAPYIYQDFLEKENNIAQDV